VLDQSSAIDEHGRRRRNILMVCGISAGLGGFVVMCVAFVGAAGDPGKEGYTPAPTWARVLVDIGWGLFGVCGVVFLLLGSFSWIEKRRRLGSSKTAL